MSRATTSSGAVGAPAYTPRTRDVESRRQWERDEIAKELGDPTSRLNWDAAHARYAAEKREYEESERRRVADGNRRYQVAVDAERRQQEQVIFERMVAAIFEGATAEEQTRVTRLIEQKHGKDCHDINIWEMTLRQLRETLRETLQGDSDSPDWRGGLREVK